jgi:alkylation response protein AidB-like acyl-CoA dehydrogenase
VTLVDRAAALVPLLLEQAQDAERARRVSDATFDALSKAGIFSMTAPKRYGGAEADFQTQCEVLAHLARGCPSTSWVATIFSAMSWLAATFPDRAQEEIFADRDPRISGVFSPTGTGVRKDGGLVVSGRWGFNTGCHGANWTVLNAVVGTGVDAVPTCVIARSAELTIVDDWYAAGMAGTGSNTIVADEVFIPAHRALALPDMLEARLPSRHNSDNPYFNYPLSPVLTVNAGGTPLGMAQGALETFRARLPGRGIAYTFYTNKSEAVVTHLQVAEAVLTLDSADAHVRRASTLLDRHPGGPMSLDARVKSRAHIAYAMGLARQAVDMLFYASGASSIQTHVPIQRFQRDVQALANHAIMHTQTALELYGRVLCGLPPNTPIY